VSTLSPQLLDALDRYLDGVMSPAERASFEQQLAASPELRAAQDEAALWQRDIDVSLRAQFSAAALDLSTRTRAGSNTRGDLAPTRTLRFPNWVPLAAAAVIGLVGLVGAYVFSGARPGGVVATVRPTLAALYNATVDSGFKPEEVCTTRDKFADWLGTKFGISLAPREERSDITLVGWSYSNAISPYTGVLLAKSGDQPIIVALDLKVRESGKGPPAFGELLAQNENLYVHKTVIDGLALYEVSPLDTPRIIDNLEPYPPGR
jgi:hypothetical protein